MRDRKARRKTRWQRGKDDDRNGGPERGHLRKANGGFAGCSGRGRVRPVSCFHSRHWKSGQRGEIVHGKRSCAPKNAKACRRQRWRRDHAKQFRRAPGKNELPTEESRMRCERARISILRWRMRNRGRQEGRQPCRAPARIIRGSTFTAQGCYGLLTRAKERPLVRMPRSPIKIRRGWLTQTRQRTFRASSREYWLRERLAGALSESTSRL